jgi:hypothetical protein
MIWSPEASGAFPAHALPPLGLHPLIAESYSRIWSEPTMALFGQDHGAEVESGYRDPSRHADVCL